MRIATLQFAPRVGDVEGNIRRANEVLSRGSGGRKAEDLGMELLVLPEMSFSGYNFPSLAAIRPYLEPAGQGPSATWAKQIATQYRCKVCVGYPEIETADPEEEKYYNSLVVVDSTGQVIWNYRKSFLYYTDETWAHEGDTSLSFHELRFPEAEAARTVATSFGICMDINPYKFEAPFMKFEFANRVLDSQTQLVVLSMAWLTLLSEEERARLADQPDLDTFNYWVQRFWPLLKQKMRHGGGGGGVDGDMTETKQVVVVFANRTGEEEGMEGKDTARYAGTSAIISITQREDPTREREGEGDGFDVKILCWDMMGTGTEGICYADTQGAAKMVFGLVGS